MPGEELVLAFGGFLGGIPVGRGVLGGQGAGLVGLELDGVSAAFPGFADEALGKIHAAFMVYTGLGNDIGHGNAGFHSRNSEIVKNILHDIGSDAGRARRLKA